jgi:DNA-directed RNA polymerase subunit RPC12/RpoP
MYLQMKLRHYDCADCGIPCKTTSPNAVRCPKCGKAWEKQRNRQVKVDPIVKTKIRAR